MKRIHLKAEDIEDAEVFGTNTKLSTLEGACLTEDSADDQSATLLMTEVPLSQNCQTMQVLTVMDIKVIFMAYNNY